MDQADENNSAAAVDVDPAVDVDLADAKNSAAAAVDLDPAEVDPESSESESQEDDEDEEEKEPPAQASLLHSPPPPELPLLGHKLLSNFSQTSLKLQDLC